MVADTAISFELTVPSAAEMSQRVETLLATYPWLVAVDNGDLAGYAYGSPHRSRAAYGWSTDVSVYVDPQAQRQGVGRALYAALLDVLRRQRFEQAFAGIALPNPASVGLHEAMGFSAIGVYRNVGWKLGRWHDVGWWQRSLGSFNGMPQEPRPMSELDAAEVGEALEQATAHLHSPRRG